MLKTHYWLRGVVVVFSLVSVVGMSACRTNSSGVLKLGPDAYTISASAPPLRGGSVEAQRIALSEANEFCAKAGKEIFVTDLKASGYNADVNFRCVEKGSSTLPQR